MAKYCPIINDKVLYLECLECENKVCKRTNTVKKQISDEDAIKYLQAIKDGLHETGCDHPYKDAMIPLMKAAIDRGIEAIKNESK